MYAVRSDPGSERGETLVELLVTIVILGIAGVAVMAGLMMSVKASDIHRKETTGSAYARSYAEAIQQYVASAASHYVPCAVANTYTPALVGYEAPSSGGAFQATHTDARAVSATGVLSSPGCSGDTGVQQITVKVASGDNRAAESVTLLLRKPCAAAMAVCS